MKRFTNVWILLLVAVILFAFTGCEAAGSKYGGDMMGGWDTDAPSEWNGAEEDGDAPGQSVLRKQLTSAEWRDLDNYEYWRSLFSQGDEQANEGVFLRYAEENARELDTSYMHEVTVTCGNPVAGVTVRLYKDDIVLYTAVTDAWGKAYVFGKGATSVEANSGPYSVRTPVSQEGKTTLEIAGYAPKADEMEIAFVVDTTGSMGDELSFLKKEIEGVIRRVTEGKSVQIHLALLFYRDEGDDYVTRSFDFVNVTEQDGLTNVVRNLNKQSSAGGGDYPEAVDTALSEAVNMQWRSGTSTKLLFHVLDAPYHDSRAYQNRFAQAVKTAAAKGIRIIPVAASGLDTLGQYIMRSAAILTGGTYTFLTDDSGIGNAHEEPEVGGFTVEYLSDMLVRLIEGYHTGRMATPVHWQQSSSVI